MSTLEPLKAVDPIALLRTLAELEHDAIQAYDTALERLEDPTIKKGMRAFLEDHRRHLTDLNVSIVDLGGRPRLQDDLQHVLEAGTVFLASLVGDHAIVSAMKRNEEETHQAYRRASAIRGLAPEIDRVLDANLLDERKHHAWMEQALYLLED